MIGSCTQLPATNIVRYGNTGRGQVLFLFERNDRIEEDGKTTENYDFRYVEVNDFKRETIIDAVIREKYSQSAAEAILANYLAGEDEGEYAEFQRWRKLAKAVSDGNWLKKDLENYFTGEYGDMINNIVYALNEKGLIP